LRRGRCCGDETLEKVLVPRWAIGRQIGEMPSVAGSREHCERVTTV